MERQRTACVAAEKKLAELALKDRGDHVVLEAFRRRECKKCVRERDHEAGDFELYGLIAIHRDVESWAFVSEDPQLAIAVEEIVNSFSPALSMELLLYNILGSNDESATCLVRYLVGYYSSDNTCEHIKTTLRNMIRWAVLAGFVPCLFAPWRKLRVLRLGMSGRAATISVTSQRTVLQSDEAYGGRPRANDDEPVVVDRHRRLHRHHDHRDKLRWTKNDRCCCDHENKHRSRLVVPTESLSQPETAREATQERDAHERALPSVMSVPLGRLGAALKLLMSNSVPETPAFVVCKLIEDWTSRDRAFERDTVRETELKMATVKLWGVMKTFEHGRCPVIPECRVATCLAFYDTETGLVTAAVDGVLYRHVSTWDSPWSSSSSPGSVPSLAKRAHSTVKNWASLFRRTVQGLTAASSRRIYTSRGADVSSLSHLADAMLSSRSEQQHSGLSVAGNAFDKPLLDNLSRFLVSDEQPDVFGVNSADLSRVFLRPGVGATVAEHKSASVAHSLSKMMAAMIAEGKEVLIVRRFLEEAPRGPREALLRLEAECKDGALLRMAKSVARHMERCRGDSGDGADEPVTELGSDVKLVCNYPSSVTLAHLEETLSMWTNFWRSALSGFSQFSRRHNTIQYNGKDAVRETESGSPSHVFHCMLVTLLNTSGVTFADSLSGRKPDASLAVNDIMLTKNSLRPIAYGLLLANKLGLRPSDVRCEDDREPVTTSQCTHGGDDRLRDRSDPSPLGRKVDAATEAPREETPTKRARSLEFHGNDSPSDGAARLPPPADSLRRVDRQKPVALTREDRERKKRR